MAGRISDAWLDELRSRVSLEEVVSEYVRLKQKGKRFWGLCPFHNEKTPSFSVNVESQLYYCYGCHKGGTVIQFVMEMERLEFLDAVKLLAERARMELPEREISSSTVGAQERERIFEANRLAARFYHETLWTQEGADALNYLYRRGLNDKDIRRFGLGASPRGWEELAGHLEAMGYEDSLLERAGLIVHRDGRRYDMFRSRVIFPIISPQGKVLGFGGRAMGDQQPKYLNTPDTPVFNKRRGLYGLNLAKKERDAGRLVLAEGYMDVISLRKAGIRGVVATLGTALTEEQARLMKRYAPEVWVGYDGDSAGQKAALRALDILEPTDLAVRVIDYPSGMDPDDFIREKGQEGFAALEKYGAAEYRMLRARDGLDISTQDGMTQYALRCCEILRRVKSPIEMENHLRRLVNETGYDREILLRQIGAVQPRQTMPAARHSRSEREDTQTDLAERALLTLLARAQIPQEAVCAEDFDPGVRQKLAQWLIEGKAVNAFLERLEGKELEEANMALNYENLPDDREGAIKMAEQSLRTIRRARIQKRLERLQEELAQADSDRRRALLMEIDELTKDLED